LRKRPHNRRPQPTPHFQGAVVHERIVFFGSKLYIFEGITRTTDAKHPAYDTMLATFKTL